MSYVLTLVTAPSHLSPELLTPILDQHPFLIPEWLSPEEAIDLAIPSENCDTDAKARDLFYQIQNYLFSLKTKADLFLTPAQHRKKKLLIADMDSTIVQSETLDELAAEAGIGEKIAAITQRAMNGELVFADALRERIALLKNTPASLLEKTWQQTRLNAGAETLVATMSKNHAHTALISGGFTYFTQKVAEICGFHENHANQLGIDNQLLDGTVIPPILGKEAKLFHLNRLTEMLNLSIENTMTIGDGANDLPMLTHAGLGIGYYPKPVVAKEILNVIRHTTLHSALFMQGYKRSEFVVQSILE